MQLSDITLNVRLRSPWEAVDLGFSMTPTLLAANFPVVAYAIRHGHGDYMANLTE